MYARTATCLVCGQTIRLIGRRAGERFELHTRAGDTLLSHKGPPDFQVVVARCAGSWRPLFPVPEQKPVRNWMDTDADR